MTDLVQADLSSESYPEFIYSIWDKNGQGVNIGIGYGFAAAPAKWSIFAYGAVAAAFKRIQATLIDLEFVPIALRRHMAG